jgi:hypothetical protein
MRPIRRSPSNSSRPARPLALAVRPLALAVRPLALAVRPLALAVRRLELAAIAAATLAICAAPASSAPGHARATTPHRAHAADAGQYRGIQVLGLRPDVSAGQVDVQLDLASGANANIVRVEVPWSALEPDAKGVRNAAFLDLVDHFMNGAASRGLKVLVVVDSTPCWASTAPEAIRHGCSAPRSPQASSYPPSNPQDYAAIAAFLVARYADKLAAFEVWNEPDHENQIYFAGPDKPQRYAAILKAAYPALKAANPDLPVLAGSLVGANGEFLRALYDQGIQGSYDALSIHYYDLVLASIRSIRSVQAAHNDSTPLWLAEFGWSSCLPQGSQGGHACVSPAVQAANLVDIFRALRGTSYVRAAIVYNLQDDSQYDFGLVDRDSSPKRAYGEVSSELRTGPGRPRGISLSLRRRGRRVVASGSGPAGDDLEVDVYKRGRLRFKATLRMDRSRHFSVRLPSALGSHGMRVRVYQYWTRVSRSKRI